jgi:hypothetical protein
VYKVLVSVLVVNPADGVYAEEVEEDIWMYRSMWVEEPVEVL